MPDSVVSAPTVPTTIRDYLKQQADSLGIPADLALAIVDTESGGTHLGKEGLTTSKTGARGFFQLMPETAKELGVNPDDPIQNIDGGLKYFKQQLDAHGGDVRLALAAYNAGPTRTAGGAVPQIPETQDYVMKVLQRWMGGETPTARQSAPSAKVATQPPEFASAGMQPASPALAEKQTPSSLFDPISGFGKGVAGTMADVGSLAERITGLNFPDLPEGDITPRTTGEKVGQFAERAAEFAVPSAGATKISNAAGVTQRLLRLGFTPARARLVSAAMEGGLQAGPAAALAEVHGDNPTSAAVISAAAPIVGTMVTNMGPAIRKAAITKMARYFERGVTRDITPAIEQDIAKAAADFIDLPLQRTWRRTARMVGKSLTGNIDDLKAGLAGPFGDTPVPLAPVYKELDDLVEESQHLLPVRSAEGKPTGEFQTTDYTDIPGAKGVQAAVGELRDYLAKYSEAYGSHMPARQLHDVKAVWWDAIYGKKRNAIVTLGEQITSAQKEAMTRGSAAIMRVLEHDAPEISKLDSAVNHAANLNKFVGKLATLERKGNIASKGARYAASAIGGATGGTAGFLAGSAAGHPFIGASIGGHVGYATGRLLLRAVTSPRWRFVPNVIRRELADSLAAGRSEQIRKLVTPIVLSATADQDNALNQPNQASSSNAAR